MLHHHRGTGSDSVGEYSIFGVLDRRTKRFTITKRYVPGTGDGHENLGHTVLYTGQGHDDPHQGFRGSWRVRLPHYQGSGDFHIWPAAALSLPQPGKRRKYMYIYIYVADLCSL